MIRWEQIRGYLSYNEPMASSKSAGLLICKWILVPALLAILGYYVVGPRVGKSKVKPVSDQSAPAKDSEVPAVPHSEHSARSADPNPASPTASAPDLDITVHKVARRASSTAETDPEVEPRKHHRRKAKPAELPKSRDPIDDQQDEGGSAGSTTAG